jgi:hypothetical protein
MAFEYATLYEAISRGRRLERAGVLGGETAG